MRTRHLTTAVTMLVLVGLLVLGAVWGWKSMFAELPDSAVVAEEPTPSCVTKTVDAGQKIRSTQVQVSVFNAGGRSGLAGRTIDALMARGFLPGDVGNAPSDIKAPPRALVWSTKENDPEARLVARQFGPKIKVRYSDEDLGPGVDVIIGRDFDQLVKAPRALTVKNPVEVCEPVEPTTTE